MATRYFHQGPTSDLSSPGDSTVLSVISVLYSVENKLQKAKRHSYQTRSIYPTSLRPSSPKAGSGIFMGQAGRSSMRGKVSGRRKSCGSPSRAPCPCCRFACFGVCKTEARAPSAWSCPASELTEPVAGHLSRPSKGWWSRPASACLHRAAADPSVPAKQLGFLKLGRCAFKERKREREAKESELPPRVQFTSKGVLPTCSRGHCCPVRQVHNLRLTLWGMILPRLICIIGSRKLILQPITLTRI